MKNHCISAKNFQRRFFESSNSLKLFAAMQWHLEIYERCQYSMAVFFVQKPEVSDDARKLCFLSITPNMPSIIPPSPKITKLSWRFRLALLTMNLKIGGMFRYQIVILAPPVTTP